MKKWETLALVCLILLSMNTALAQEEASADDTLYVKQVENLPDDFVFGMDASCVPSLERSGVVYRDFEGNEQDVFQILAQNGITDIRVRVWVDPYDASGNGYGGGNCNIDNAVLIGQRAAQYGLGLIVSFHYSDFWADPGKQMVPKAWQGMDIKTKTQAVYEYTRECLQKLKDASVPVHMVAVGNETNQYLCGEKIWFNIQYLMQAGAKATREIYPEALVALHFANPETADRYMTYARKMDYYQVDYDVFATSYYPYWHGTLDNLAAVLSEVAQTYGKKVMVMETSYAFTSQDSDFSGNTISDSGTIIKNYPFTVQGQANCVRDLTDTLVNKTTNAIGLCYWEGTWISVGTSSWEENHEKWEKYGSGWASSYAASYDPDDAGKYYGGCAVDNQALFDANGSPLESLKVFKLMKSGNEIAPVPDALEDVSLIVDLSGQINLPDTVNAVMSDNSKQAVAVSWDFTPDDDALMHSAGPAKYEITGKAGDMTAVCYVSMVQYNFLTDYSFEEGGISWEITDLKNADELYIEDKKTDSLTGTKHMHFWSAAKNSVEFTLEQQVNELPNGSYRLTGSIMGGDCGETEIYLYVKLDGEIVRTAPMKITSYGNWDTVSTEEFAVSEGQEVRIGVYVKAEGTGNGAWGKIDDMQLNSVQ